MAGSKIRPSSVEEKPVVVSFDNATLQERPSVLPESVLIGSAGTQPVCHDRRRGDKSVAVEPPRRIRSGRILPRDGRYPILRGCAMSYLKVYGLAQWERNRRATIDGGAINLLP